MRWWQRALGLLSAAVIAVVGLLIVVDTVDEAVDRFRARDGAIADGIVVDRYTGRRSIFPDVTVEYAVAGRTHEREIEGFIDLDEQVQVRYLPQDPAVSRVVGEGGPALVADVLSSLLLLAFVPYGARASLRDLRRPRPPPRRKRAPEPPRPGDHDAWRRRVSRGTVVGAAAGVALWGVLASLLGAGPPREVVTALLGTVGSCSAAGALVGLLASGAGLRRTGRGAVYRLGAAGLVLAVPAVLVLAAALER